MKQSFLILFLLISVILQSQNFSSLESSNNQFHSVSNKSDPTFVITHSNSFEINPNTSVSCNTNGIHFQTSYFRVFDLEEEFLITDDWQVDSLVIGIAQAESGSGVSQELHVLFHVMKTYNNEIVSYEDSLTLKAGPYIFDIYDSDSGNLLTLHLDSVVNVAKGQVLVVEVKMPDGHPDGNSLYIGSNDLGETDSTYIRSIDCGIENPVPMSYILYPDMHMILYLIGQYENPTPQIISFEIEGQLNETQILSGPDEYRIDLVMPVDTELSALSPTIQIPAGFEITPASGEEVDFSSGPVQYTVDNLYGSESITWDAFINLAGPEILDVSLDGEAQEPDINNETYSVTAYLPTGSDLTELSPFIQVYEGFTVDPASGSVQDFSQGPVEYTVSHESPDISQSWYISVETIDIVHIDAKKNIKINLYPNPASEYVHIEGIQIQSVQIVDLQGKIYYPEVKGQKILTDMLSKGFYILKISSDQGISTNKLMIR
jgi:hypothetical protein